MLKMNRTMENLIESINENENAGIRLSLNTFGNILLPDFIEINEVVLLNVPYGSVPEQIDSSVIEGLYMDKTGYEASRNEFYVNSYVDYEEGQELIVLGFGLKLLKCWGYKLKRDFPNYHFCLILSYSDGDVILRFHMLREDEQGWLANDLEGYKLEGVLFEEI
jgi:hypothetical protein